MINVLIDNKKILGFGIYQDDSTGAFRVVDFHENTIREESFDEFIDAFKYVIYCEDPNIPYTPVSIDLLDTEEWTSDEVINELGSLDILTQFSSNGIIMGMISPIHQPIVGSSARMLTVNFNKDITVNTQLELISKITDVRDKIRMSVMTPNFQD